MCVAGNGVCFGYGVGREIVGSNIWNCDMEGAVRYEVSFVNRTPACL